MLWQSGLPALLGGVCLQRTGTSRESDRNLTAALPVGPALRNAAPAIFIRIEKSESRAVM